MSRTLIDEATRLRWQGASIVIALAHAGGKFSRTDNPRDLSSCEPKAEIFETDRRVPAGLVDAVVAGHRHELLAHEVNGIPNHPILVAWACCGHHPAGD